MRMNNIEGVLPATTAGKAGTSISAERVFRGVLGSMVLAGALLALFHHPNWLYFSAFVGLLLIQSALTTWCPLMWLLRKLGFRCTSV
jgi:hypothetical protein